MKPNTYLFVLSLLFFLLIGCNQPENQRNALKESTDNKSDSLKNITKLEKFLSKKGELFVKDFYKVGTIHSNTNLKGSMEIEALVIYNPGEEDKRIKGLKIDMKETKYSEYSSYDKNATVFLDMDGFQPLLK